MKKLSIPIKGMHCRSCEMMIEEEINKIPGIKKIDVDHKKGIAEILYDDVPPPEELIKQAIKDAGYETGTEKRHIFSRNTKDYTDLITSISIVIIIYLILSAAGIHGVGFSTTDDLSNIWVIFLIGITAGMSSCMALVGGLVLGMAARFAEKNPQASPLQKFKPHIFFNAGRIISYFFLGGLIGTIGSTIKFSPGILGYLVITAGIVMLFLGLQLIKIFPVISRFQLTLPKVISKTFGIVRHAPKEYSNKNAMTLGALTFFLPCGFTQAMQVYAISTGSFTTGAVVMGIFALGTTPGMLGIGGLTSIFKGKKADKFFTFIGVTVIALAFFNISNGLNLAGISLLPSTTSTEQGKNIVPPKDEDGKQIINMTQSYRGYSPNEFTVKKGIPVKWVIESEDNYSCASSLILPKYEISKNLTQGENIIEFTPSETGRVSFTCSMGMYKGWINVIE